MTALFQGKGDFVSGPKKKTHLPQETSDRIRNQYGRIGALKSGSVGPTYSDMQIMQQNERKQHQQAYLYEHGHNDGSAPLGTPSF